MFGRKVTVTWKMMYRIARSREIFCARNIARETAGLMCPPARASHSDCVRPGDFPRQGHKRLTAARDQQQKGDLGSIQGDRKYIGHKVA